MRLFKRLGSKPQFDPPPIPVDVHSHLLPGIDDGSQSMEESIEMIRVFSRMGYKKLITTPHILQDYYPNTPEIINSKLDETRREIRNQDIDISLDAAAEYYLDEFLMDKLRKKSPLLNFGDSHLLFEMSFVTESPYLREFIFESQALNYKPVLAHVERYPYFFKKLDIIGELIDRGCLIQVNINSLSGYYSKPVMQMAEKLISEGFVHLIGSDCHNKHHLDVMQEAIRTRLYSKVLDLPILNHTLADS